MKRLLTIGILLLSGADAMAYEEPEYELLRSTDAYEVRRYAPYIVAEVEVEGSFRSAGNRAFRILAGYIFGDNQPQAKMNMTIPVESVDQGQKMNMTVPVESRTADDGGEVTYTYAFVMERAYSMETLPRPNDERIRLVERPSRIMAVRPWSGSARESRYEKEKSALLSALESDGLTITGVPAFARFNGPMTPWFMKRNEILVEIESDK
ncbi:MAG: heme-binding protein [Woeseiaceae bacterium]|nr:heme-binding protein [Woeseiaceae bacterium]